MQKKRLIVSLTSVAIVVATVLFVEGCSKKQSYTFETTAAARGSVSNIVTATGTLEAITSVQVGTQVSGIVEKLYVDFNSVVKKGQVLAQLDKTALKSNVDQALASLENARAEKDYQEATYNRTRALWDKNLVAEADYDLARFNYEKAKSSLKTAQASYDKALVNLGYATIFSPIDGVVVNRAVEEGQTVAASFNTPEIFTIAQDLTQMKVEADIDETDIGVVKEGQRVEFSVDAFPEVTFTGTVTQIRLEPTIVSNVVTYTVIINAPNPDQKLLPGLTATINIYVDEAKDVLVIPYKAVRFTPSADYLASAGGGMEPAGMPEAGMRNARGMRPGTVPPDKARDTMPAGVVAPAGMNTSKPTMVWVKSNGTIHPVPVVLGINNGTLAEVRAGLKEGDEVVTAMNTGTAATDKSEGNTASSPFMPKRPGSSTKSRTTASK